MTKSEKVFVAMTTQCSTCGRSGRKWRWENEAPGFSRTGLHPDNGALCEECLPPTINNLWGLCEDGVLRHVKAVATVKFKGTLGE